METTLFVLFKLRNLDLIKYVISTRRINISYLVLFCQCMSCMYKPLFTVLGSPRDRSAFIPYAVRRYFLLFFPIRYQKCVHIERSKRCFGVSHNRVRPTKSLHGNIKRKRRRRKKTDPSAELRGPSEKLTPTFSLR